MTFFVLIILKVFIGLGFCLPNCTHPIYCDTRPGSILDTIQRMQIFDDQKTFVDMPLKKPVNETLAAFNKKKNGSCSRDSWISFVEEYFDKKGSEIVKHTPSDYVEQPAFLSKIADSKLKEWAKEVHKIWPEISRKVTHKNSNDMYSSINVPHPFIVPGGRFDGFYYWDSYFVILGLLVSEMYHTAYQMIQNFYFLVDQYDFIPNGMRIYFLSRSQPPLLTFMVDVFYERTKNLTFLSESMPYLMKEYDFWKKYRTVEIKNLKGNFINRYSSNGWGRARPESYLEDIELTSSKDTFDHIIAAAESGLDFSSKWFRSEGDMKTIETGNIAPVELNSYLYHNELLLSKYAAILENSTLSSYYRDLSKHRKETMEKYMWDKETGQWWDLDWESGKKRMTSEGGKDRRQYLTSFFPSFLGFDDFQSSVMVPVELLAYPGGVPFSLYHNPRNPQQWDFPNAWAPTTLFMIEALDSISGYDERFEVNKWISNCYCSWKKKKSMYEKYDVEQLGLHGGGGEYVNQVGFGWTNGVTLYLLSQYGDSLKANSCLSYQTLVIIVSIFTSVLVYCIMICVGCYLSRQCYLTWRKEKEKLKEFEGEELDDSAEINSTGMKNEEETSLLLDHQEVEDTLQGIVEERERVESGEDRIVYDDDDDEVLNEQGF